MTEEKIEQTILAYLHKTRFDEGYTYNQVARAIGIPEKWTIVSNILSNLSNDEKPINKGKKLKIIGYPKIDTEKKSALSKNGRSVFLYKYCPEKHYFQGKHENELRHEFADKLAMGRLRLMCDIIKDIIQNSDVELGKRAMREAVSSYMHGIRASYVDKALDFGMESGQFSREGRNDGYKSTGSVDIEKIKELIQTDKYRNYGSARDGNKGKEQD